MSSGMAESNDTYSPWNYRRQSRYDRKMDKGKSQHLLRLGENIRSLREKLSLSQEELAFQAGLDRTYLGGAERGERNLTILSALKICKPLEVSLSTLVEGVSE